MLASGLLAFPNEIVAQGSAVEKVVRESNVGLAGRRLGLLLVGHGTRDARGVSEFLALADQVAGRLPNVLVRPGFLEFSAPTVGDAVEAIASRGVDSMVVVPALLFAAGHAKRDIPRVIKEALLGRSEVPFVRAEHFGTHEQLIELSHRRYQEATSELARISDDETMLLLIGRGSRDRDANAEMLEFSKLRQHLGNLPHVTTAFFAMADPSFELTIQELQRRPFRRIVVQPHLLFFGQIMAQIVDRVNAANLQKSDQEWVVCEHLGRSSWLAQVVIDRFIQALT